MRILLDECVPARVKDAFPGHSVQTVTEAGWRTTEDESLLSFAEKRFDVFVTVDRKLERQVDLARFDLGFVIVRVRTNRLDAFKLIWLDLAPAAEETRPGKVVYVTAPGLRKR